ncbi:MAG: hypothetical protein WC649_08325 [Desulfobacteria bacterium]
MRNIKGRIEDWFAAVAFAEAGEGETALEIAGIQRRPQKKLSFDNLMAAITFAEAGVHEYALEFAGKTAHKKGSKPLSIVLPGVKIWYGTATVTC